MARRTAVILIVGLTESLLGERTPRLSAYRRRCRLAHLEPPLPAVTTTGQATMLTGLDPADHGIVGNGWFDRLSAEVRFWKQSNRLVRGEKVWETARRVDPSVTCAKLFWWYNMYSSADVSVTPRPIYRADGRKIPDCYSEPADLRDELQGELGRFPLFKFWGPGSSIESSDWIVSCADRVRARFDPTLTLVYLPHLDYALQKFGPGSDEAGAALAEIDASAGAYIERLESEGVRVVVVSEYGLEPTRADGSGAVFINRALREAGMVRVRTELVDGVGGVLLVAGASRVFAVADHQIAHVYVRDADDLDRAHKICGALPGVGRVLDARAQREAGVWCDRSGDLLLEAEAGCWFAYDYWLDGALAPDFARTVDIHRKPGYDPRELYIDPAIGHPRAAIGWRLAKKRLGLRTLMDVVPLDASLVRGTHGRAVSGPGGPLVMAPDDSDGGPGFEDGAAVPMRGVRDVILGQMFGSVGG
mgnify:CR=1 FL=1